MALRDLLDEVEADPQVRVVVFESADEEYFVGHFDVLRAAEIPSDPGPTGLPAWADIVMRLQQADFVTIAVLRGRARGVGSEFALACDLRYAARERAILGQPEVGVGLVPGGGALEQLPLLAGRSRTLEIVLGSDDFDADTAEKYGWVTRTLPDSDLDYFVNGLVERITSFSPEALVAAKRIVNERSMLPSSEGLTETATAFRELGGSPEGRARIGAALSRGLQQRGEFERDFGKLLHPDA